MLFWLIVVWPRARTGPAVHCKLITAAHAVVLALQVTRTCCCAVLPVAVRSYVEQAFLLADYHWHSLKSQLSWCLRVHLVTTDAWGEVEVPLAGEPQQSAAAAGPTAPDFQEAAVSLVPPQPSKSGSGLSGAAVKALSKLLVLCGLPPVSSEEGEQQQDAAQRLTTFLPEAAEV